jgi:hypothetical protein
MVKPGAFVNASASHTATGLMKTQVAGQACKGMTRFPVQSHARPEAPPCGEGKISLSIGHAP